MKYVKAECEENARVTKYSPQQGTFSQPWRRLFGHLCQTKGDPMKRLSVWVAAISFGAMGVSAHRSSPPQPTSDEHKRVIAPPDRSPWAHTVPESWPAISCTSPGKARANATAGC